MKYHYERYGSYFPGRRIKLSGDLDCDFGYTGHYFHASSALHLTYYRAYDANFARWLSRDPIAEKGGMNLYGYVSDNPINGLDLFGLEECCPELKRKIRAEKGKLIQEAQNWNKTSPGWSTGNQCGEQSANLAYALSKLELQYWTPSTAGGSRYRILGVNMSHHQVVVVSPYAEANRCGFKMFILDGYKDVFGGNSEGNVSQGSPENFRCTYPYPHPQNPNYP